MDFPIKSYDIFKGNIYWKTKNITEGTGIEPGPLWLKG